MSHSILDEDCIPWKDNQQFLIFLYKSQIEMTQESKKTSYSFTEKYEISF